MSKQLTASSLRGFAGFSCRRVDYEFKTSSDKFNLQALGRAFKLSMKDRSAHEFSLSAVAATREPRKADYHVHFRLRVGRGQVEVVMGYVEGAFRRKPEEKRPYAEDVMGWLGSFFQASEAQAHVTCVFDYSRKQWRTPLPVPMKLPSREGRRPVEVNGMFLTLPARTQGGAEVWLIVAEDRIMSLVDAKRMVRFSRFNIYSELGWLSNIAKTFVERKTK